MKDFIAVMDSGVGGISVLIPMHRLMPDENFLFYGDSANAPYGTKSTDMVRSRVLELVADFLDEGAKAIAIACNTATSAAVKDLREIYPEVPIVGIEPALKPAVTEHEGGRILVMATPMTIREEKFKNLLSRYGGDCEVIPLPCPGLMEYVEGGKADTDEVEAFLRELLSPYLSGGLDAVVLGCTHYPFIRKRLQRVIGSDVEIYDGSLGTAKELRRRISDAGLLRPSGAGEGTICFRNSDKSEEKQKLSEELFYSHREHCH